jgi:hypothetical protein
MGCSDLLADPHEQDIGVIGGHRTNDLEAGALLRLRSCALWPWRARTKMSRLLPSHKSTAP